MISHMGVGVEGPLLCWLLWLAGRAPFCVVGHRHVICLPHLELCMHCSAPGQGGGAAARAACGWQHGYHAPCCPPTPPASTPLPQVVRLAQEVALLQGQLAEVVGVKRAQLDAELAKLQASCVSLLWAAVPAVGMGRCSAGELLNSTSGAWIRTTEGGATGPPGQSLCYCARRSIPVILRPIVRPCAGGGAGAGCAAGCRRDERPEAAAACAADGGQRRRRGQGEQRCSRQHRCGSAAASSRASRAGGSSGRRCSRCLPCPGGGRSGAAGAAVRGGAAAAAGARAAARQVCWLACGVTAMTPEGAEDLMVGWA